MGGCAVRVCVCVFRYVCRATKKILIVSTSFDSNEYISIIWNSVDPIFGMYKWNKFQIYMNIFILRQSISSSGAFCVIQKKDQQQQQQ